MINNEKFLVTGAGGFIGGWLAETLFLSGSTRVRAGVHNWQGAARPARFPMEIVLCDIMNPRSVADSLVGVSHVIHCARGPSRESIVQGTLNMLEESLKGGVKRFIHISTTEVYGHPTGMIDESFPCRKAGDPYGDSKVEAEHLCRTYHEKGLPVTVIRPSIVYGPFSETWTVNIAQKLESGNWGKFEGYGEGLCNLIYISDLVTGILLAARNDIAAGETYNMNGQEVVSWNEYFRRFNAALDLPELKSIERSVTNVRSALNEPLRTVAKYIRDHFANPVKEVATRSYLARRAMKSVERMMKTSPRRVDFDEFTRKALYVSNKAKDTLGFSPRFDLDTGLEMTVLWLKQVGLVNRT